MLVLGPLVHILSVFWSTVPLTLSRKCSVSLCPLSVIRHSRSKRRMSCDICKDMENGTIYIRYRKLYMYIRWMKGMTQLFGLVHILRSRQVRRMSMCMLAECGDGTVRRRQLWSINWAFCTRVGYTLAYNANIFANWKNNLELR